MTGQGIICTAPRLPGALGLAATTLLALACSEPATPSASAKTPGVKQITVAPVKQIAPPHAAQTDRSEKAVFELAARPAVPPEKSLEEAIAESELNNAPSSNAPCKALCRISTSLHCPVDSGECMTQCAEMAAIPACSQHVLNFMACASARPSNDWRCDDEGKATVRDGVCEDEQDATLRCLSAKLEQLGAGG